MTATASAKGPLLERDLALLFDARRTDLVHATDTSADGAQRLPAEWYDAVTSAIRAGDADIADAIGEEDERSDFDVVSSRVTPCSPLTDVVAEASLLCWPQVRLVWQPIVRRAIPDPLTFDDVRVDGFADDRAIHALYDASPEALLPPDDAREARKLRDDARAAAKAGTGAAFLASIDGAKFRALRDRAAGTLRDAVLALRTPARAPSDYAGIALRPESAAPDEWRAFLGRYRAFLDRFATPRALEQLTAFSLSRGRTPTNLFGPPRWIFVSLRPLPGGLAPEPIAVRSPTTGAVLATLGTSLLVDAGGGSGTSGGIDAALAAATPAVRAELLANTSVSKVQSAESAAFARARITDPKTVLVANTDCASCHQLDTTRSNPTVDFHNLSRFDFFELPNDGMSRSTVESDGLQISPRVRADVAFDLAWFAARFSSSS